MVTVVVVTGGACESDGGAAAANGCAQRAQAKPQFVGDSLRTLAVFMRLLLGCTNYVKANIQEFFGDIFL